MKYILTKKELGGLVSREKTEAELDKFKTALEACRLLIIQQAGKTCQEGYCDDCPVSSIGYPSGMPRISDLNGVDGYEISNLICSKYREYPK